MSLPIRSLILLTGLCMCLSALAQSQSEVSLRFVSFPPIAEAEPIELLIGNGETIEVQLPTNSISQSYSVPALETWALGKSNVDSNGKFTFNTFGSAESLGTEDQMILVVRQGAKDADGLCLIPFKSNDEGLGGGKYLVLNAANVDIDGSIGTAEFTLRPMQHRLIAPEPTRTEDTRQYAFAKFHSRDADGAQPFFSSTWRFNERARTLVFFHHERTTNQLRVHTIRSAAP